MLLPDHEIEAIPELFKIGQLIYHKTKQDNVYEVIAYGKMRDEYLPDDLPQGWKWVPCVTYRDIKTHDYYTREREDFLEKFASYQSVPKVNQENLSH